jgi:tryptophan-rich hypothetical protein
MNTLNPKKLLNSKWTALNPVNKEKHFLITEVDYNEDGVIVRCLFEAVKTGRSFTMPWRELKNSSKWAIGWH